MKRTYFVFLAAFTATLTFLTSESTTHAALPEDPGLYYEDIESHPFDFALYGIFNEQQEGGAFGYNPLEQLEETYYAIRGLLEVGYDTSLPQISNAIDFLSSQTPKNRMEQLYVLSGKKWNGEDITNELLEIISGNNTGEYGWRLLCRDVLFSGTFSK